MDKGREAFVKTDGRSSDQTASSAGDPKSRNGGMAEWPNGGK